MCHETVRVVEYLLGLQLHECEIRLGFSGLRVRSGVCKIRLGFSGLRVRSRVCKIRLFRTVSKESSV